jgi:hypothetical protein
VSRIGTDDAVLSVVALRGEKRFGRTKLMKCLYFLKEDGLDVEAEFDLYTWGPFSAEVLGALGREVSSTRLVKQDPTGDEGYDIRLGPAAGALPDVLNSDQKELVRRLSSRTAQDLEALSTLHFVATRGNLSDMDEVVNRVKRIKPYFRIADLQRYWAELVKDRWIQMPPTGQAG